MNLNDVKKLEVARSRADAAEVALKKRREAATAEHLNKAAAEFREYFSAAGFTVATSPRGLTASIGQMTFKLEMNESDVAGALGAVKIIPPAESKEEPTTLSLFRKLAADGPVTTLHLQELTPLQEMEKKAADLEAALQRPFPEVEFVRMQVTARVGPYGARGQAPRPKVERFGSFTEALSTLYPSS
ncbi:hypothetical protein KTE11_27275 [Burkholderia multivorans]|uniref:hypothetical protein n=1 Tax=Burkholderia multivorans TaxID=87883 RepID=UPI001C277420|nr:hypothetical protein [Burkholderia multivorans]MBU9348404.1 hypothetical protein [Burkholderia multivorans]